MCKQFGKKFLLCMLACLLVFAAGCGKINTDHLQKLEPAGQSDTSSSEPVQALQARNELPEDGIVTKAQLETIAGKTGIYEFYATDPDSGIAYVWSFDGSKIQNPAEQRLKVRFITDGMEEIQQKADKETVGLGFVLEQMELAAPATLQLILPEAWDADAVLLCKLVEGSLVQMAEAESGTETIDGRARTILTFPVLETGDPYYLVKIQPEEETLPPENSEKQPEASEESNPNMETDPKETEKDEGAPGNEESTGQEEPSTSEPEEVHLCTISIDCAALANHMDLLRNSEKAAFVPADGWLLYAYEIEFTPGESVYDVLYRACQQTGYQMEASYTPLYGSYYVEGINNLYEFDGGELSGWMYSVNGWYPNYGCSSYEVSDGDAIRFRYTCDLGGDIGGSNVAG